MEVKRWLQWDAECDKCEHNVSFKTHICDIWVNYIVPVFKNLHHTRSEVKPLLTMDEETGIFTINEGK